MGPSVDFGMLSKKFDFVGTLSEGLIAVKDGEKWFHVHSSGERAYKETFRRVGPFKDGAAWVLNGTVSLQIGLDGQPYQEQGDLFQR